MLIEFRVENHRSVRDEQVLTMEAGRVGAEGDPRPRHVEGHAESLLPVAALYGANASGKSNVLAALAFMRSVVLESHRNWPPDEGIPRDPFAWGPKRLEPSLYEVTVLIESVRYQFGFVASDECFLEEWLHVWPHGKKQVWYERDNNTFKFGENLKGENKLIEAITRPNALFLSAAVQHKHSQLQPLYTWFRSFFPMNVLGRRTVLHHEFQQDSWSSDLIQDLRFPSSSKKNHSAERLSEQLRGMLNYADVGIEDLRLSNNDSSIERLRPLKLRIELKHISSCAEAWLPLEEESDGTKALFDVALPILRTIKEGSLLLIDELEASLHPSLAQWIVGLFNDPLTNPRNAQLLFTTHDTNLLGTTLGEPALRRDQVWLTEKDAEGATVLYPLTDYKPRKAENLERGYLQGRYGAIPFLGNFTVTSE